MSKVIPIARALYVRDAAEYRPATLEETLHGARQALSRKFRRGCLLETPTKAREHVRLLLAKPRSRSLLSGDA